MAKQYEQDYRDGKTSEGSGIATAHSQRSNAKTEIVFDVEDDISIEELVTILRSALPTETQSLVKRLDEQAFAILNGENPIFVEHVARRLSQALDSEKRILDWNVHIEHWESLHSHNAVAYISKVKS
jgi:GTP cyclohydrolase I